MVGPSINKINNKCIAARLVGLGFEGRRDSWVEDSEEMHVLQLAFSNRRT